MRLNKENKVCIGLFLFLVSPTLLGLFLAENIGEGLLDYLLFFLAGISIYVAGISLLKKKTFFYIATITFVPNGIEIVHLILNHATTSLQFLYTCVLSEIGELMELATSYWWVFVIACIFWITYLYLLKHYVTNEYIIIKPWLRYVIAGVCVLYILVFWNRTQIRYSNPTNFVYQNIQLIHLNRTIRQSDEQLKEFSFNIQPTDSTDDIVVLLIGETSRYDHWQINGYSRPTSPLLAARSNEIISFDSCYSVSNLTAISVPMMLSRATPENMERLYTEKSVVEAFEEADWRTAWLANQSFTNAQLLRISSTCDNSYYFDTEDKLNHSYIDSVLLMPLENELTHTDKPQMIVIHSLGCHYKYSSRYPESFSRFQPDLKERDIRSFIEGFNPENGRLIRDKLVLQELRELFVNSYDNAILYTDNFINEIICQLEQTNRRAILIYVGDHGENLLDDDRNMLMHGTYFGSKYEYHVPLIVWTSNSYREAYPQEVSNMAHNKNKAISTMTLFHSLLDAGHIEYEKKDSTLSILSDACRSHNPIIILDANLHRKEAEK